MSYATRSKRMKSMPQPDVENSSHANMIQIDQTTAQVEQPLVEKLMINDTNKMDFDGDIVTAEPIVVNSSHSENGAYFDQTTNEEPRIETSNHHHNGSTTVVSDQDMIFVKAGPEFPNQNHVDEHHVVKLDQATTNDTPTVEVSNHDDEMGHWNQQTTNGKPMTLSSEEEALRCKLVVKSIMDNFVAVEDLKIFRLVNKTWNDVATKELLRRDSLQVTLAYQEEEGGDIKNDGEFFLDSTRTAKLSTYLLDIKKWISSNEFFRFPSKTLAIRGGDLGCTKIEELFSAIGPTITTLSLTTIFHGARTSKQAFRKILLEFAPNIETLQIDAGFSYQWNESEDKMWLYSLKTFVMPNPDNSIQETVKSILLSASNLETLQNVSIKYSTTLIETGKLGLVKEIVKFGNLEAGTAQDHINFAKSKPRLGKFVVNIDGSRMNGEIEVAKITDAVNRILVSSQCSLVDLQLDRLFYGYFAVQIWGLNLRKLVVRQSCTCHDVHERHGVLEFSWNYPALEYLSYDRFEESIDQLHRMNNIESLKVLEVGQHTSEDLMHLLHSKFPNVKILKLRWMGYSSQDNFLRVAIETWTELEELEVSVNLSDPVILPDLDSAFTGMTVDECRRIRKKKSMGSQRIMNFERTLPWIGSIKGLKSLKICFESVSGFSSDFTVPLTIVSALYAFQELPALQVTIRLDRDDGDDEADLMALKNCLAPIFPFVNLVQYSKY